jgi:hypothetical protein
MRRRRNEHATCRGDDWSNCWLAIRSPDWEKTREMFKERFSFFRDASMGRESMKEGWTGGTNDGATEKSLEGTVRADYLH